MILIGGPSEVSLKIMKRAERIAKKYEKDRFDSDEEGYSFTRHLLIPYIEDGDKGKYDIMGLPIILSLKVKVGTNQEDISVEGDINELGKSPFDLNSDLAEERYILLSEKERDLLSKQMIVYICHQLAKTPLEIIKFLTSKEFNKAVLDYGIET